MANPSLLVAVLFFFGLSLGVLPFLSMANLKQEWPTLQESQEQRSKCVANAVKANNYYFVFINQLISLPYYEIRLQTENELPNQGVVRGFVTSNTEKCAIFLLKNKGQKDLFSISISAYARRDNHFHPVAIKLEDVPPGSICELVDYSSPEKYLLAGMTCRNGDAAFTKRFFPGVVDHVMEGGKTSFQRQNVVSSLMRSGIIPFQPQNVVSSLMHSGIIPFQPEELAKRHKIYATITNNLGKDVSVSVTCMRLVLDHHHGSTKPQPKQESTIILAGVINSGKEPQDVDIQNTLIAFKLEEPCKLAMEANGTVPYHHIIDLPIRKKTDGATGGPYASYDLNF